MRTRRRVEREETRQLLAQLAHNRAVIVAELARHVPRLARRDDPAARELLAEVEAVIAAHQARVEAPDEE